MSKKSFDYKKKMNQNRRVHRKNLKKMLASSAIASSLVFQPFVPIIQNGQLAGFTENTASAATLAEVSLFSDANVTSNLTNIEGSEPYNLEMTLTGGSLIDANVVNPETVALFYSPDLAGVWQPVGDANVQVQILPLTMEDLPVLGNLISGLTGTLTDVVSEIVSTVDRVVGLVPSALLEVNGLDELQSAFDALNNVEQALADLLLYEENIPAVLNTDGSITVDFSDGLNNHLETAVNDVVLQLLDDLITAAQALEVNILGSVPIVGDLVNGLVNGVLSLATETIVPTVQEVVNQITTGAVDLTGDLASAQVLGETQVTLNTAISKDAGVTGEVPISGAAINTNVIDLQLLNSLNTETIATFPAADDTEAPSVPVVNPVDTDATEVTGTAEPESTVAVTLPNGETATGTTDAEGNFVVTLPDGTELAAGDELSVTATDVAGNTSDPTIVTVTETADTEAPAVPVVNPVDTDATEVTGTAEPESTVAVTLPNEETATGTTDTEGNFVVTLPDGTELSAGDELTVTATDAAGNESAAASIIVSEVADEEAPEITAIEDGIAIENLPIEDIVVEVNEPSEITTAGLPEGLAYDETTGAITGTPVVSDWGEDEEERLFNATVTATDEAGNASEETFALTIQRDTDGDGIPDVDDNDDDNDGATDEEENEAGTDPKDDTDVPDMTAPEITTIADSTAIENLPIEDIVVEVNELSEITTAGLPEGLAYDETAGAITGTPVVSDWGEDEEERLFNATVTATDEAENASEETFALTIQRDTDGDGIPDVDDNDDDNDGATDEEENEAGTDPKDDTDTPDLDVPVIDPIANTSAIENAPIDGITVGVDEPSEITTTGLPSGLDYDEAVGAITGTPVVEDWGLVEEERGFAVTVTATDEAGNASEENFILDILRDTDGDGIPDVDDNDDDNDGATDEEENEAGTDPKDDTDVPGEEGPADPNAPVITPIANAFVLENQAIDPIEVTVEGANDVVVADLPAGLSYDEASSAITGTPVVEDWGVSEEQRGTLVTVTASGEDATTSEETFAIVVQRDTDGDGIPDVEDNDDDNDGATDEEENEAGTDPKDSEDVPDFEAPSITAIEDTTAVENTPIDEIAVEVDEPSRVSTAGLPTGLVYNPVTQSISGTPVVEDWAADEEEREFSVTVTATDEAGNTSEETFALTIQRDTDGDGIPDITDEDDDNDGATDEEESEAGTDPKDEDDVPDMTAPEITAIADGTAIENLPIEDIVVEVNETSEITTAGLPEGLAYDEEAGAITGTPVVSDWGEDEETRLFNVTVTATDEAGNASEETFALTIQRDTDGDGIPDITDEDDDNDGATDEEENEAGTDPKDDTDAPDLEAPEAPVIDEVTSEDTEVTGTAEPGSEVIVTLPNDETVGGVTDEDGNFSVSLPEDLDLTGGERLEVVAVDEAGNESDPTIVFVADTTAPIIVSVDDQTVVETNAIEDIQIVVQNPGEETEAAEPMAVQALAAVNLIQPLAAPIESVIVEGLPDGVAFDAVTNVISGIPEVSEWEATEEERNFEITVTAQDEAGNAATETFMITVQRDTDGDGIPDVDDNDDDNDGATDEEEIEAGTDPKDETDTPELADTTAPVITPIADFTAVENTPIEDITVEVDEPSLLLATGFPEGITFDAETGVLSGAPVVADWGADEEERTFSATVSARDAAGNESAETLAIVVQRDTDGDGIPDVNDTDDDNDGATDEEEIEAGTDPKDNTDTPAVPGSPEDTEAPVITPIPDVDAEENQPIEDIEVEVNEPSDVVVDGLPSGVEYDPETGVISGTPVVEDWAAEETERVYTVIISAEDAAGNVNTLEFTLNLQRDLDGGAVGGDTDGEATDPNGTNDGSGSNEDSDQAGEGQETLPQTGESASLFTTISGFVMAAAGAAVLAWNKMKDKQRKKS